MPRSLHLLALAALVLHGCHRVDEPATGSSGAAVTAPLRDGRVERCVASTPAEPPPAAPAAPADRCPRDPKPHTLGTAAVEFREAEAGVTSLTVEMAVDPDERTRGLMFRTAMAEDRGMLFDMKERKEHAFWMRNTCIPLDMLFLDDDGLVVGIVENVPTLNEVPRAVPCPSTHVLEVNAGWSRRHGVRAGQRAVLPLA